MFTLAYIICPVTIRVPITIRCPYAIKIFAVEALLTSRSRQKNLNQKQKLEVKNPEVPRFLSLRVRHHTFTLHSCA